MLARGVPAGVISKDMGPEGRLSALERGALKGVDQVRIWVLKGDFQHLCAESLKDPYPNCSKSYWFGAPLPCIMCEKENSYESYF